MPNLEDQIHHLRSALKSLGEKVSKTIADFDRGRALAEELASLSRQLAIKTGQEVLLPQGDAADTCKHTRWGHAVGVLGRDGNLLIWHRDLTEASDFACWIEVRNCAAFQVAKWPDEAHLRHPLREQGIGSGGHFVVQNSRWKTDFSGLISADAGGVPFGYSWKEVEHHVLVFESVKVETLCCAVVHTQVKLVDIARLIGERVAVP